MIDEKVIDAEFDKDDCGPFDSPISAYKAGFRTAERLTKIEVLEEVEKDIFRVITRSSLAGQGISARIKDRINELKALN